jgi:hypothetical protein
VSGISRVVMDHMKIMPEKKVAKAIIDVYSYKISTVLRQISQI